MKKTKKFKRGKKEEAIMISKSITLILLICLLSSAGYAVSIGISPGRIAFDNLLRNGYAERTIKVTTNSEQNITAHFKVGGEIAEWLKFEPNSTVLGLSSSEPYILKIIVLPPNDTRSDSYSGEINFVTDRFGNPTGRAGGLIKAAVTLNLIATVIDIEERACRAGAFEFKDIEIGYPIEISYKIINDGNVRIKPTVKFDIWDQLQENLIFSDEFVALETLPTIEKTAVKKLSIKDFSIGQYWANIAIDECKASSMLSFNIVEKGAIIDKGLLEKVSNKVWTYVDEPVEITATFKNMGPRIVSAKFKGNIMLENKIVKAIETEEIDAESGQTVELKTYFSPLEPGRYVVTGRVIYNKKLTFEKGSIINVTPKTEKEGDPGFMLLLIYLIILVTITFIIRKIIKAKKRQ